MALALRHAILPKRYAWEYKLHCEWGTYGKPEQFYTDSGKDFRSNHLSQIAAQLGFICHLRVSEAAPKELRPSEGGVVERPFKTFNDQLFSTLPGYTGSNVQERPEDAEKDARLTLRELEQLLIRYIVDRYNQSIDARMGDQTRFERWEAGLPTVPTLIPERDLDICLMKQSAVCGNGKATEGMVILQKREISHRTAKLFLLLMSCERDHHISRLGIRCIIAEYFVYLMFKNIKCLPLHQRKLLSFAASWRIVQKL